MRLLRLLALSAGLILGLESAGAATIANTRVRLLLAAEAAVAGEVVMAGVELRMGAGWHTYWRNHGDAGFPTQIKWQLPPGVTAGAIQWPVPEKIEDQGLFTYGYSDLAVLLVPLRLASDIKPGPLELKAAISWVECKEQCIPGEGSVQATLTVGSARKPSANNPLLESAVRKLPQDGASLRATARWDAPGADGERPLVIQWETNTRPEVVDFFPYASDEYEVRGATDRLDLGTGRMALRKVVASEKSAWPVRIAGLIVIKASGGAARQAYEVLLSPADPAQGVATRPGAQSSAPPAEKRSLLAMLGLAFLGGLILNVMPCVLPVIALKILGFVSQSRDDPARVRRLGIVYTLGVLASFIVLAGLVIGVQQAGKLAVWGMQFNSPQFLVGMTVLVTLVALNLFGVFEVTLGGGAMNAAGALASKEGAAGAFFNGVLATALATPCTAPYLGAALGFAFAQPPPIIVLMFSTIGLGLAAPYLVLSWEPAWLKFLPKPGAWMEKFKVGMGFPMLATAVWMYSLALGHFGEGSATWLGLLLVLVGFAAWIWGDFVQRGSRRRGLAMGICVAVLAASYLFILEGRLEWRKPQAPKRAGESTLQKPGGVPWRPWSREAVEQARAEGHPVLVDFTADWCLTCQANKKTSLEIPAVVEKLKELNAVPFLGDNTRFPPEIAEELRRYKRAGVPLVLVFPADRAQPPIVLPEILRPKLVLEALDQAAGRKGAGPPSP